MPVKDKLALVLRTATFVASAGRAEVSLEIEPPASGGAGKLVKGTCFPWADIPIRPLPP